MEGSKTKGKFTIKRYQIPTLFNRDIFKRPGKAMRPMPDRGKGLSLSEIQIMVNSEEESNLSNKDVKCFLIKEHGHNIKFNESVRKNASPFVFHAETKVEYVINSLLNINAAKSAAEVIKESLLGVHYNLDDSFCDAQDLKQSWRQTKVPDALMIFSLCFNKLKQSKIYAR